MTKQQSKLNNAKSQVIEDNFLQENPELVEHHEPISVVKELPEMRRVLFLNSRDPGVILEFHYASKTHPLARYKLSHGFEYDLPVEVIDHLETRAYCQYGQRINRFGESENYVKGHRFLYQCRPVKNAA